MWKTLSGLTLGKGENYIARANVLTGEIRFLKIINNYLYVKKCNIPRRGNIIVPEKSSTWNTSLLVLAKAGNVSISVNVDDIVFTNLWFRAENPKDIIGSDFEKDEYFIKEDVLMVVFKRKMDE